MDAKEFASAYGEAFGPAAGLPLLFWYSDGPVRAVPKVEGCFSVSYTHLTLPTILLV